MEKTIRMFELFSPKPLGSDEIKSRNLEGTVNRVFYFIEKALANLRQSFFLNVVAVSIFAFLLCIFGGYLLIYSNVSSILELWGDKIQVVVYLKEGVGEKGVEGLKKRVKYMKEVESFSYVPKEIALERFKKSLGGQGGILEGLESNPLPASLEITLARQFRRTASIIALARLLRAEPVVEDVQYGQEWVEKYSAFKGFLLLAAVAIGCIIFFLAFFIVVGVIYVTVTARRDEIEIQKLVGATNAFVKAPFLIEGFVQGIAAGLLAVGVLFVFYRISFGKVVSALGATFGFSSVSFLPGSLVLLLVLGSAALSLFGSWFAVGRFLKV